MAFIGVTLTKAEAGGFALGHWAVHRSGEEVEPHGHEEAHFIMALSGYYASRAAGDAPARRAPFIYNPPQTFHSDRFETGSGSFFTVSFAPGALDTAADLRLPDAPLRVGERAMRWVYSRLIRECAHWAPDATGVAEALCLELLGALEAASLDLRRPPPWLRSVLERLNDDPAAAPSLGAISRDAGVHPTHLVRTFRQFLGCTPGDYLRGLRVERAAGLLVGTRSPVAEIGLSVGFADQSHFTRNFSKAFGIGPAGYRERVGRARTAR